VQAGGVRVEAGFGVTRITTAGEKLRLTGGLACRDCRVEVDELIVAAGFPPKLVLPA
jgi:hypothetical protein